MRGLGRALIMATEPQETRSYFWVNSKVWMSESRSSIWKTKRGGSDRKQEDQRKANCF